MPGSASLPTFDPQVRTWMDGGGQNPEAQPDSLGLLARSPLGEFFPSASTQSQRQATLCISAINLRILDLVCDLLGQEWQCVWGILPVFWGPLAAGVPLGEGRVTGFKKLAEVRI